MSEPSAWHRQAIAELRERGVNAGMDAPDSVLLAEARNLCPPGSTWNKLAGNLATDITSHASGPVSRATCAALIRAAADLKGLAALGAGAHDVLGVLSFAAAKLEMKAPADG